MKKLRVSVLICLFLCSLTGCKSEEEIKTDAFLKLGYSDEEVTNILALSEDDQEIFNDYNKDLVTLLTADGFKENNLKVYDRHLDVLDKFDETDFMALCNDGYLDKYDSDDLLDFMNDKYFMYKNLDLYMKYLDDFETVRKCVEYVNTKGYKESYVDYEVSDISKDILMIASKIYSIEEYIPDDLITLPSEYVCQSDNSLREEAYNAYIEMADAAREEDMYFYVSTSYRSYDFQTALYNKYLETDSQEVVDTYSSRPGFSDHQTGLTVDIRDYDKTFDDVKDTEEMLWLRDNSYLYGFIMRYPEGKEDITRYEYEWWHFRYVGKEAAKIIHDDGITFDEYYEYYVNN